MTTTKPSNRYLAMKAIQDRKEAEYLAKKAAADTVRPDLTPEVVDQLRAFHTGDIFPVIIIADVLSPAGNTIIAAGDQSWAMWTDSGYLGVWTGHTHYAGCKSASVHPRNAEIVEVAP